MHFPWCLKKCPYCDFVSYAAPRDSIDHEGYARSALAEIALRRGELEGRTLGTVFFGGGTPSLWEPWALGRVLAGIRGAVAAVAPDVEVTVECNPTSIDEPRARALADVGVNRLSLGVQGLSGARLDHLGRLHDPKSGLDALVGVLRAGLPRVSADLIYGVTVPDADAPSGGRTQSPEEAAREASTLASTGLTHLSAYALTIEQGTLFGELARRGRLPLTGDDVLADSFVAVEETLASLGLAHYEVSNFARPGDEARHNLAYWKGRDYVGLGASAVGTMPRDGGHVRYRNHPDPRKWAAQIEDGALPEESVEELDGETRLRERIMLGLRLAEGFDLAQTAAELGVEVWPAARKRAAERLVARGRLLVEGGLLRVPRAGWLFADGTAAELF